MSEKPKPADSGNLHVMVLGVLGIVLLILGAWIVSTPGAPMRGSGVGTLGIVAGLVLLVIAGLRYRSTHPR
jgi:hypothetical protein